MVECLGYFESTIHQKQHKCARFARGRRTSDVLCPIGAGAGCILARNLKGWGGHSCLPIKWSSRRAVDRSKSRAKGFPPTGAGTSIRRIRQAFPASAGPVINRPVFLLQSFSVAHARRVQLSAHFGRQHQYRTVECFIDVGRALRAGQNRRPIKEIIRERPTDRRHTRCR